MHAYDCRNQIMIRTMILASSDSLDMLESVQVKNS